MVTEAKLEKLKIDVVEEVHGIRKKFAQATLEEIEQTAAKVREEIRKKQK